MRAHLSVNVRNVGESVSFYERVFNQKPQKQTGTYAKFDLLDPSLNFSLVEAREDRLQSQVNHLGIEVGSAEDVSKWNLKLQELGIKTETEDGTDCCYAIQDKVWFQDPDGNHWEIFYVHEQLPTEGAEPPRGKRSSSPCSSTSGCC